MRASRDRVLWAALAAGLVLRLLPLALWPHDGCVRDECTYIRLATRMAAGEGMTGSAGWIWAPGHPALMAVFKLLTGYASSVKALQLAASMAGLVLVYRLARRVGGGLRSARVAAWLYALSPHLAFYAGRLWSEVLYGTILLGAILLLSQAREAAARHPVGRAALVGLLGGVCMLFRGVATYMLPIFAAGLLWRRWRSARAWLQAAVVLLVAAATVAPYSVYATRKFGALVVTDRTLGQMMWLGDNDFEPITFDWGNGQLSRRAFARTKERGRRACAPKDDPIARDACQVEEGIAWIRAHPGEFLRRVPMRVAQLLNPHSLLTRHLRWGRFPGMPQLLDELVIAWGAAASLLATWLGTLGLAARGRGASGVVVSGILLYHVAAIAVLAGLTRYRVPLEPLLMVYAAPVLAAPGPTLGLLRRQRWRLAVAVVALAAVVPLSLWYLPAAWPRWRHWF